MKISRPARKTSEEKKWNKSKPLPLIDDIRKFREYLIQVADESKDILDIITDSNILRGKI